MFDANIWGPLWVTVNIVVWTTLILATVVPPVAAALCQSPRWARMMLEPAMMLPLVVPPTVLGFYFLWVTSPQSGFGILLQRWTGLVLPFSQTGIVIAATIAAAPLALRPMTAAMDAIDERLLDAARCMGLGWFAIFFRVIVPTCRGGIVAGLALAAAHTSGAFGVILMVGGNIPGVTRTLSIAIYDDLQKLDYAAAHHASVVLIAFSLGMLWVTQWASMARR